MVVGDWNHAVARTATTSDCGLRSESSKYRVMLTVECASCPRSTHAVWARDCAQRKRRQISPEQVCPRIYCSFHDARKAESLTRQNSVSGIRFHPRLELPWSRVHVFFCIPLWVISRHLQCRSACPLSS